MFHLKEFVLFFR